MKSLYQKFFAVPDENEKISEKLLYTRVGVAVFLILALLAGMSMTAYAYFTSGVATGSNQIKAASFDLIVLINGEEMSTGTVDLFAGTYEITVRRTGTASTGFCRILIGTTEYHTQQLGADVRQESGYTEYMTFKLQLEADATVVRFLPNWGTSSYYGVTALSEDAQELYILDGDTVVVPKGAPVDMEDTGYSDTAQDPGMEQMPSAEQTPGTEPTTKPTLPPIKLELNRSDFTLSGFGSTYNLYSGELDPASITWTSSNEEVATVTNGIVKAVGNGMAVITAEYDGQKVTCDIHCNEVVKGSFELSTTDTTIQVGESFTLKAYLVDENGEYVLDEDGNKIRIDPSELKFYVTDAEEHVSVDEKGKVTGLSNNLNYSTKYKYVYVEYNGVTRKCIVRVKNAPTTE